MTTWNLTYSGTTKTFAEWGLGKLHRSLINQSPDIVSFVAEGAAFDGTPLFSENSVITIKKDDTTWFTGRIIQVPRVGASGEESIAYRAAGPWWYLDNLLYQQTWKCWNGVALADTYKSRVIIGQSAAGAAQTSGQVITEVINYAITRGVPIQLGTVSPDITVPWSEAVDITCAEAIRKVIRWTPDAVCWFDYMTSPNPTFHCMRRSEMEAVSFSVNAGAPNEQIDIKARTDLKVPAVVLKFERSTTVGDEAYESVTTDVAPAGSTGLEFGALVATLELSGARITLETQEIEVEAIPADLTAASALDWWKARAPCLSDPLIDPTSIVFSHITRGGPHAYANELIKGVIKSWMTSSVEFDCVTARVDYATLFAAGGAVHRKVQNKVISYQFTGTSATTKTYKRVSSITEGEAVPSGMAAKIYAAVGTLQYDGDFSLVESEITGAIGMGNVLNLTDGVAAWATMRALIQSVEEDVDAGQTKVNFGPPTHLGPDDLIELLRANRVRNPSPLWEARTTGDSFDAGHTVKEEGFGPKNAVAVVGGEVLKEVMKVVNGDYTQKINVDPAEISKTNADVHMKPREIVVCVDGVAKKMQILASEPYD